MKNLSLRIVAALVLAGAIGVSAVHAASLGASHYRQVRDGVAVQIDTSACSGFAPAAQLELNARLVASYTVWRTSIGNEQVGWTDVHASASIGGHVYRIAQRYHFRPRQYREYVDGWATTILTRDDGASMVGASWLGLGGSGAPVEGVWWQGTPTCRSASHS